MELPQSWTVVAKRGTQHHNGITLWRPINGYTYEQIETMYNLAMNNICFMVHKKTEFGYDLLVKENPYKEEYRNRMNIRFSTSYLSNKIYNN